MAIVVQEPDDGNAEEPKLLGLEYFLEIAITREILEGVDRVLDPPSVEKRCEVAIYYATYDAWPLWLDEAAERVAQDRSGWKFAEPWDLAVVTSFRINGWSDWIARVFHDADDGGWRFLGPKDLTDFDNAVVVTLERIFKRDNSVGELGDLPEGWHAWRESAYAPWQRAKIDRR